MVFAVILYFPPMLWLPGFPGVPDIRPCTCSPASGYCPHLTWWGFAGQHRNLVSVAVFCDSCIVGTNLPWCLCRASSCQAYRHGGIQKLAVLPTPAAYHQTVNITAVTKAVTGFPVLYPTTSPCSVGVLLLSSNVRFIWRTCL